MTCRLLEIHEAKRRRQPRSSASLVISRFPTLLPPEVMNRLEKSNLIELTSSRNSVDAAAGGPLRLRRAYADSRVAH